MLLIQLGPAGRLEPGFFCESLALRTATSLTTGTSVNLRTKARKNMTPVVKLLLQTASKAPDSPEQE